MSTIIVQWTASDEAIRKEYIKTGKRPDKHRKFALDLTELTPEQRKPIIESGKCVLDLSKTYTFTPNKYLNNQNYLDTSVLNRRHFDQQPTADDVVTYCHHYLGELAKGMAYKAEVKAKEKAEKKRVAALEAEWQPKLDALITAKDIDGLNTFHAPPETGLNRKATNAWRELKAELAEADKFFWIAEHGSEHLKEAFQAGYDCQRKYVLQRAAKEFPSFEVDFNNTSDWKTRSCPSPMALRLAQKVGGKVVWLTTPASSDIPDTDREYYEDYYEPFEACEAVVIRRYLDKYDLVKIV